MQVKSFTDVYLLPTRYVVDRNLPTFDGWMDGWIDVTNALHLFEILEAQADQVQT